MAIKLYYCVVQDYIGEWSVCSFGGRNMREEKRYALSGYKQCASITTDHDRAQRQAKAMRKATASVQSSNAAPAVRGTTEGRTMIEPRDCDGGLVDLAAAAAGFHPDERIGLAEHDVDCAAQVARDLSAMAFRVLSMPISDDFGVNEKAVLAEMIREAERYADSH